MYVVASQLASTAHAARIINIVSLYAIVRRRIYMCTYYTIMYICTRIYILIVYIWSGIIYTFQSSATLRCVACARARIARIAYIYIYIQRSIIYNEDNIHQCNNAKAFIFDMRCMHAHACAHASIAIEACDILILHAMIDASIRTYVLLLYTYIGCTTCIVYNQRAIDRICAVYICMQYIAALYQLASYDTSAAVRYIHNNLILLLIVDLEAKYNGIL